MGVRGSEGGWEAENVRGGGWKLIWKGRGSRECAGYEGEEAIEETDDEEEEGDAEEEEEEEDFGERLVFRFEGGEEAGVDDGAEGVKSEDRFVGLVRDWLWWTSGWVRVGERKGACDRCWEEREVGCEDFRGRGGEEEGGELEGGFLRGEEDGWGVEREEEGAEEVEGVDAVEGRWIRSFLSFELRTTTEEEGVEREDGLIWGTDVWDLERGVTLGVRERGDDTEGVRSLDGEEEGREEEWERARFVDDVCLGGEWRVEGEDEGEGGEEDGWGKYLSMVWMQFIAASLNLGAAISYLSFSSLERMSGRLSSIVLTPTSPGDSSESPGEDVDEREASVQ